MESYFLQILEVLILNLYIYLAEGHLLAYYVLKKKPQDEYDLLSALDNGGPLFFFVHLGSSFYVLFNIIN